VEAEGKVEAIKKDIKSFNMKMPSFSNFEKIKSKLNSELGNWLLFMQFRNEVEKYEK
jgi:hypothetical protein